MADRAPTLADTVVINAMSALVTDRIPDTRRQAMHIEILAEAVNRANWDHDVIGPLIISIRKWLDMKPDPQKPIRQFYMLEIMQIEADLVRVFEWRLGHAYEEFSNRKVAS